jgi:DNA repair exonuclease SbcCD ATPase subunit
MSISREDLIRLLREDPTLLEELRALVLTKDLLELPARTREEYRELRSILRDLLDIVRQIIDILSRVAEQTERNALMLQEQARMLAELREQVQENSRQIAALIEQGREHDKRLAELSAQVQENSRQIAALIEQGREHDRRLAELSEQVAALVQQGRRHDELIAALIEQGREHNRRLAELAEQGREFDRRLREITEHFQRQFELVHEQLQWLRDRFGTMYGQMMEIRYRQNPYGYFSEIVRRAKWVTGDELDDLLSEALSKGLINEDEQKELMLADLIIRGVREGQVTWLVVEVSGTIYNEDVDRAIRRSQLLARCLNEPVLAVVAGEFCPEEVLRYALRSGAWVLLDGSTFSPRISQQT